VFAETPCPVFHDFRRVFLDFSKYPACFGRMYIYWMGISIWACIVYCEYCDWDGIYVVYGVRGYMCSSFVCGRVSGIVYVALLRMLVVV